MNLPNLSIRQPVFILMIMLSLVVVGFIAYSRLPVDLFPDVSNPTVSVTTTYPGAGPAEVEQQVSQPLEQAISTLNGVVNLTSTSQQNVSRINVQFGIGSNIQQDFENVREKVSGAQRSLPNTASIPTVSQFDTSSIPILTFSVADRTGKMKSYELRNLVLNQLQPRFEQLDGVADVTVNGGQNREIDVDLNLDALRTYRLSPQQVAAVINNENVSIPGGTITQGGKNLLLRVPGQFTSPSDIASLPIASARGAILQIKDIGVVTDTLAPAVSYSRLNGKDSVSVQISKLSGTNTVSVAQAVKNQIASVEHDYPGLGIVISNDQSAFIQDSIQDSLTDLLLGGIFASLVVLFFFRDLRNTLVTVAGLPIIMIGTFAVMNALGLTLNMMTLLALSLAVGLVIDDAIVVRENIFRHMEAGETPREASSHGTNEVALSVLAMTLTVVSVFFPIAFTTGTIGRFYSEFGIAITAAVLISLFEAFTFAPMLSAYMFKQRKDRLGREGHEGGTNIAWLDQGYRRALTWTLDHMKLTALVGAALLALIVIVVPQLQLSFLPRIENGNFQAGLLMPTGTALDVTDAQARKIETSLMSVAGVQDVITTVGSSTTPEQASFNVVLTDYNALAGIESVVRKKLAGIPGLTFNFQGGFGGGGTRVSNRQIQVTLLSYGSYDELNQVAQTVSNMMSGIPGLADVALDTQPGEPEVSIQVDRNRAAQLGLNSSTVGNTVNDLVNGDVASIYEDPGKTANIVVQLRPEDRSRLNDILSLTIATPSGQIAPLREVATIANSSGPSVLTRLNQQTEITVGANTVGRSQAQVVADISARMAQLSLPSDVTWEFQGNVQQTQTSLTTLLGSLALSVIFMYMVLASQFGSLTQPIVLMLALPLAIIGAFGALLITHTAADMTAGIGLILLMGLAVKNSILLVDFTNRMRAQGMSRREALLTAGPVRLRPVLMTTLSLILGMLPVALGLGAGGSFRAPMAIAVIGGLITSTILTLLIVPVAYSILDIATIRVRRPRATEPVPAPANE